MHVESCHLGPGQYIALSVRIFVKLTITAGSVIMLATEHNSRDMVRPTLRLDLRQQGNQFGGQGGLDLSALVW